MKEYPMYFKVTTYMFLIIMIVFVMYMGSSFLIPISLGILLTFLLLPVSRWLENKRVPKTLAIILSIILMIIAIVGLMFFFSTQFMSFSEDAPLLKLKLMEKFVSLQHFISERFNVSEGKQIAWLEVQMLNTLQSSGEIFGNIFSATGNFLAAATLIPIYIFFFTFYKHKFLDFMKYISPADKHDQIIHVIRRTSEVSQKYLVGLLIDICILAVLNSIGFLILGIKHAILLGVIAGLLNIIPYIGVLIGSIFPILMALLTKDSIWIAVGALAVCVFVQFLDNNFITPKVVGSAVSINPLATMIALLIGGSLWGVAGMMVFIPFFGMLKVIFDNVDQFRPIGFLIGEEQKIKSKKKTIFTSTKTNS
ncbi:MAG TPA: AI-2E family transporter [Bacteroidia bacterium]|nr:AI-2E family transporter [Bacteroidia bacterium]